MEVNLYHNIKKTKKKQHLPRHGTIIKTYNLGNP
jgi:hypothetical protein